MVVIRGVAVSYDRSTPVNTKRRPSDAAIWIEFFLQVFFFFITLQPKVE